MYIADRGQREGGRERGQNSSEQIAVEDRLVGWGMDLGKMRSAAEI